MIRRSTLSRRPEVLLLLIVVGYLVFLTVQVRHGEKTVFGNLAMAAFGPFLTLFNAASSLTHEGVQAYIWQRDAALRADRAEMKNRELEARIQLDEHLEHEVIELRALIDAPRPRGVDIVGGRALTQFGAPFGRYLLVSCPPGVAVPDGTPIMSTDGAVGRVIGKAGDLYRVLLITDPNSAVGVVSARTGVNAVAVGAGDHLTVHWVSNEADVKVGDEFVTSGEDGYFPSGVRVCVVTSVENGHDYLKKITASPLAQLGKLRWVLLLKGKHA